jgi:hypothetical protein
MYIYIYIGYRCGSVVEKKNSNCNVDLELGFLNTGCYPSSALLQGVAWPEGVEGSKREQYLSETEFYLVFGIAKDDFNKLEKYIRVRMKKEKLLF